MATRNQQQPAAQAVLDHEVTACRRLWASVVRSATDDILVNAGTQTNGSRALAWAWVFAEQAHVGSFLWCCDVLGLDSDAVRDKIRWGDFKHSKGFYAALVRYSGE